MWHRRTSTCNIGELGGNAIGMYEVYILCTSSATKKIFHFAENEPLGVYLGDRAAIALAIDYGRFQ